MKCFEYHGEFISIQDCDYQGISRILSGTRAPWYPASEVIGSRRRNMAWLKSWRSNNCTDLLLNKTQDSIFD